MLVAIAEELATKLAESGEAVMDALVIDTITDATGTWGNIRIGVYGYSSPQFYPDENVYMPEYELEYFRYRYKFEDGVWVSERELLHEAAQNSADTELPF
jgi:hypothetical protein